jgi:hypothetical protein
MPVNRLRWDGLVIGAILSITGCATWEMYVKQKPATHAEFWNRFSNIKEGCKKEELIDSAGKPDERSNGKWCYRWSEPNGGYYDIFCFTIKNGIVTKIERLSGHETVF